jgi:2-keto-3-deoxy-L-fuconate dehydrogenase
MSRLTGKKVFLTAAGQGIGRAAALAMANEGAEVIATDVNEETVATLLVENSNIEVFQMDALDLAAIQAAAERVGAIDVLFNCTGFVDHGSILECDEESWDFSFNLNAKAQYRLMKAFLPAMIGNGGGSVINMSSVASSVMGVPDRFIYGASKAAVIGMTKSVAKDFVGNNIRCNCICPGTVQTPSLDDRINAFDDPVQARKEFIARQPMGRIGTTDELSALIIYLASDESAYTTGQEFVIDGAMSL